MIKAGEGSGWEHQAVQDVLFPLFKPDKKISEFLLLVSDPALRDGS